MSGQPTAELATGTSASGRHLTAAQAQWLADLYRANFTRVFRTCQRLLRNPDDAADATHEVFLRALDGWRPRSASDPIGPWLLAVARNHCLDILRRRQRLGKVMVTLAGDRDTASEPEQAALDRQVVAAIFKQLPSRERQALWQSAVERRSLAELASDLRLSYMATAQLVHRARRHALLVASRLAAILGLVQLGRTLRRASLAAARLLSKVRQPSAGAFGQTAHQLLAVLAVPLVLASVQSGSSAAPSSVPPLTQPAAVVPKGAVRGTDALPDVVSRLQEVLSQVPLGTVPSVPPIPLPTAVPLPTAFPLPTVVPSLNVAIPSILPSIGQLPTGTGTVVGTVKDLPSDSGLPVRPPVTF